MTEWFRPSDFIEASAGEIPTDVDAFSRYAAKNGWRADRRRGRVSTEPGGGWEYHYTLAPIEVQARLTAPADRPVAQAPSKPIWQLFERLSNSAKQEAAERLAAVDQVEKLSISSTRTAAVAIVAAERSVSQSTLYGWLKLAAKVDRADRLAALAPQRQGRTATAECDPRAWDYVVAEYMRAECPRFEAIFRRLQDVAAEEGWGPIPHSKTLKRRIEKEIPAAARVAARKGSDVLKRLYPAQQRDRRHFGPLQAVTIDGHKLDVFVAVPGLDKPTRVILVALQDLGTGLIVGWNLDLTETRDSVRLAIADMVERYGIPDDIYLDNGRGFASKLISGGQPSRFRFKYKADEPLGVLTQLGIRTHWTTPYGAQLDPIDR
ncbi:DNA-binding domain-containing protein [Labrys sp. 22185]|uniref:DNA-binding domain-containing protein n=1 Tax=Labrys sp. 22185 TaxID=3453888 RepID=UPI003F82BDE1